MLKVPLGEFIFANLLILLKLVIYFEFQKLFPLHCFLPHPAVIGMCDQEEKKGDIKAG